MFLEKRTKLTVCGEAANGREAVEKTLALKPDLVLLDLLMPELNGAEVASIIKKSDPDIRIILFTIYGETIGRSLTSAIGVDAVLSKPDGMTALVKTVEEVLGTARPPPETGAALSGVAPSDPSAEPQGDATTPMRLAAKAPDSR
jgi:NarL family two-component system response regulator LiaR